jgi:hypothetical protein
MNIYIRNKIDFESIYFLDCREDHMKTNKSLYVCVKLKGQKNINGQSDVFPIWISFSQVCWGWEFSQSDGFALPLSSNQMTLSFRARPIRFFGAWHLTDRGFALPFSSTQVFWAWEFRQSGDFDIQLSYYKF